MNKIKNTNYEKELKIYNEKAKALNHELANEETWFTYENELHLRTKTITPFREYKKWKAHFIHNVLSLTIFFFLLFIGIVCLIAFFCQDEPIFWFLLLFFTPIIPYFFIYLFRVLFFRKKWIKILSEHNIIKPKKWLINTRNTDYEN
ncbi:MAG: hypothetical protein LBH55_00435 [Mycoplasmataceae bacterium]|nr:hypothetical protein [Mycoplasmataceae bacterium]